MPSSCTASAVACMSALTCRALCQTDTRESKASRSVSARGRIVGHGPACQRHEVIAQVISEIKEWLDQQDRHVAPVAQV